MLRTLPAFSMLALQAGCISFGSSEPAEAADYIARGQDKAAPCEGLEYKCECKKPPSRI